MRFKKSSITRGDIPDEVCLLSETNPAGQWVELYADFACAFPAEYSVVVDGINFHTHIESLDEAIELCNQYIDSVQSANAPHTSRKRTAAVGNMLALKDDIIAFCQKHRLDQDICIYVGGDRYNIGSYGQLSVEKNVDPRDYFDYVREPNLLSMSFEGPLYEALNYGEPSWDLFDKFHDLFSKYGVYFELGDSWNLSVYPD